MKTYKLVDISLRISSGLTPLRSNVAFWENGLIPWLKTEQLGDTKYIYNTNEHISEIALKETSLKLLPENTLSIAMYGEGKTRGNLSIIKTPMTTNQACCNVEIDPEKADFEYVYYFLKTQYEDLRNLSSGVRKNLNSNDIKNYPIHLPSLKKQHKIAQVLSTLDRKIALNQQINAELEKMAKTLYDYWFVQFDFPDENGNPYKSSGGEMVYNPELKRDVPKGWEVKKLGEIEHNIITGKTPSKKNIEHFNGNIPFITIGDIRGNTFIVKTDETLTDLGANTQRNKFLPENAICVTCIATVGLVGFTTELSQTNQQINSIICSNPYNRYYLYFSILDFFSVSGAKTGNTFANMNKTDFENIKFIKPNESVLKSYYDLVYPIFEKMKSNAKQTQKLTQLRDFLLPMLMNGQVEVG